MKIAIIGYGKMGKAIEKIALERNHEIVLKITSKNQADLNVKNLSQVDVAIEFSIPENAAKNISICFDANTPVAVGTTAWYNEFNAVELECKQKAGSLLTATNFSIGVNILFEINKKLASLMSKRTDYSAQIQEIHHTEKLDSPSGTAITLAEGVLNEHQAYDGWVNEASEDKKKLEIVSYREPNVPGTHEVSFESSIDKISIKHRAKNREGFALGAVLAAEFIKDKKGIFTMEDVLNN